MGTHESQSLFWERHVGLSKSFFYYFGDLIREELGFSYSNTELYKACNKIEPSLIRVEADELTYPLHVILRTKIERDVTNGDLEVDQIPRVWNEEMQSLLNIEVPNDGEGCLQDIHWSGLAFGYFPTYLIGAIAAAQLEYYIRKDLDFNGCIEKGEFGRIEEWLKKKVHVKGSR